MFDADILSISLSHLASIGLQGDDRPENFKYGESVKNLLSDSAAHSEVNSLSQNIFQITVTTTDYSQAILNDLYFGGLRISEQCKNLEHLLSSNAQPAWVLLTAYYAAYFMANDISKANGKFVINLNNDEFSEVLSKLPLAIRETITVESNNPFFLTVDHGQMTGELILNLRKSSPKPHQIAWDNFSQIANKIKIDDSRVTYLDLLKSIVSPSNSEWQNPSAVRNTWNYSQSNYFGAKGIEVGKQFSSIIKSASSTFGWARNNNLKPTMENSAASVAYIYHTLKSAHLGIIKRLNIF